MWKIPLSDVDFDHKEIDAAAGVINSGWLTMGEVTRGFEKKFSEFLGVRHAIAVSSCTAALHLANLALNIGRGDEVICPSLTFVAGVNSVLYTGAKPVFADITGIDNFNISSEDIERKITKRTRAIQVLHYAGFPCDMRRITAVARKYGLNIIEDCAHAIGSSYKGRMCGTIGDIGAFSFFSNKNMTTAEGGMVVTNDDALADKITLMRSHGMTSVTLERYRGHAFDYDVIMPGFNYRIDELRSAIGVVQLEKLRGNNAKRRRLVELYRQRLSDASGMIMPFSDTEGVYSHHIFPILLNRGIDRPAFMRHMKKKGIQTSIHYQAVHLFDLYRNSYKCRRNGLALTEQVAGREVTLPLYPSMNNRDVCYVCDAAEEFLGKRKD